MWPFPGVLSRTSEGGVLSLALLMPGERRERWHLLTLAPQGIVEG